MLKVDLVTREQGLKLKKLGFDIKTEWAHQTREEGNFTVHDSRFREPKDWNKDAEQTDCSAPSVPIALKWLRDKKGMYLEIHPEYYGNGINFCWMVSWYKPKEEWKKMLYSSSAIIDGESPFYYVDVYDSTGLFGDNNEFPTYEAAEEGGLTWILNKLLNIPNIDDK